MSIIRPLDAGDLPVVAAMFLRVLRREQGAPPDSLVAYMKRFYLDAPGLGEGIGSLVHVTDAGQVSGFIGVHALPMQFEGRPLRAAICGSLMAEDRARDPMAGARLLKAVLDGPQNLTLSESANDISVRLWTRLRGVVLAPYSLDWVRVIRPSAFGLSLAANRVGMLKLFNPLARALDGLYRRRMKPGKRHWAALPAGAAAPAPLQVEEVGGEEFSQLLEPLSAHLPLRPRWTEARLDHLLADAAQKPALGQLVLARVSSPSGGRVGAFAYYVRAGQVGRVLQVLALPGQAGAVIDRLIEHAAARGAAGLRGRTQPALLEALLARPIAFVPVASTVAHSRDADLLRAMTSGQAFFNGLAGEQWSRLIGGTFA